MEKKNDSEKVTTALLIKSGFWYTLAGFLSRGVGFITIPIFTRILTNEQIGDFAVFTSWLSVLIVICGIELPSTINRARFDFEDGKDFDSYIFSCLILNIVFTGCLFLLFFIFPNLFYSIFLVKYEYTLIMFIYLFSYPSFAMILAKQRISYKYKFSAGLSIVLILASSLLSVVLTKTNESDPLYGRILGQYVLYVVAGILSFVVLCTKSIHVEYRYIKYAFGIGLPLALSVLGNNILLSADNLVVKHLGNSVQVSYIALIHSVVHIVLLFVQAINNAWAPWLFDKLSNGQYKSIKKAYTVIVGIVMILAIAVLFLGPEIIIFLGGKNYYDALYILPISVMSGVVTIITSMMVNLETYHKKTHYAAIITGIIGILNIILNIIGVLIWDYKAVCYVTFSCHVVSVLLHYYYTTRMRIHELITPHYLMIIIMIMLMLIPISLFVYTNLLLRVVFGIIALSISCIIIMRNLNVIALLVKRNKKKY